MKKLLCIVSRPPYQSSHTLELIETAMVGAVFDFQVSVLFRGEGVWSVLRGQNAAPLGQRTLSKVLTALPTYDVDAIYVCDHAAAERKLNDDDFVLPVSRLSLAEQADLIAAHDAVMGAQT